MSSDLKTLFAGQSAPLSLPINIPKLDLNHENFRPVTKKNVGYIVCGLAFNDDGDVLMMQEAKESCRGRWYLPAGRLEPNETLVEGVKREVAEETGLNYEPETILCVEMNGVSWQRITFIGKTTSGRLKPKPDEESLDAKWMKYPDLKSKPIRSGDIFSLIELGLEYLKLDHATAGFTAIMPIEKTMEKIFLRFAVVTTFQDKAGGGGGGGGAANEWPYILVDVNSGQLPVLGMGGVASNVKRILTSATKYLTNGGLKELTCKGLLAVEHDGRSAESDGLCHTFHLKVTVESSSSFADGFRWMKLEEDAANEMKKRQLLPAVLFL